MGSDDDKPDPKDKFLVMKASEDKVHGIHVKDGKPHLCSLGKLKDGEQYGGDLVKLEGEGPLHDIKVVYRGPGSSSIRSKPVTPAYGDGWDRIFGKLEDMDPDEMETV